MFRRKLSDCEKPRDPVATLSHITLVCRQEPLETWVDGENCHGNGPWWETQGIPQIMV